MGRLASDILPLNPCLAWQHEYKGPGPLSLGLSGSFSVSPSGGRPLALADVKSTQMSQIRFLLDLSDPHGYAGLVYRGRHIGGVSGVASGDGLEAPDSVNQGRETADPDHEETHMGRIN